MAATVRDEADRRHILDLAAIYERTADNLTPPGVAARECNLTL
jgi:hypothetical protein